MRSIAAMVVLGVASIGLYAQPAPEFKVSLLQGGTEGAAVWAQRTHPYWTGAPSASVQALPLKGTVTPTATSFRLRTWKEDGQARVVVFAVTRDESAPNGERETQIATFLLGDGASKVVTETAKYQAAPITVRATRVGLNK